jgi:hypothetical protein
MEIEIFLYLFAYFEVLGFEHRASLLLVRHSTSSATLPAFFFLILGISEIGPHTNLFTWAGFEL